LSPEHRHIVTNGSEPPLRVLVRVATETFPNWWSGLLIDPNHQFAYEWPEILNPSEIGGLAAGCPADQFVDSYNALVFAA
jgi:hypothetical protein